MFDIHKILHNNLYKKLDLIICQSYDMAEHITQNYNIPKEKTIIINNPISNYSAPLNNRKVGCDFDVKRLITVGRLSQEKGILRLIKILSKCHFNFSYTIIGDGIEKESIFQEAKKHNILDKINHIPFTKDVNTYLSNHDLFLQGSYVEGFPNALLESCVAGTPVIAFDVPGGTKEIISNGNNGFLVTTEDEFLLFLNKDVKWKPHEIREFAYQKFNKEKILKEYEKMFLDVKK